MASGAVTLLESQKDSSNLLKTGTVETLIQESPILEQLPMMSIVGNALESSMEYDLPDPEFRDVNAPYTRSFGTDRKVFWGVAILGGEVFVDNFIVRTRGNVVNTKAKQYRKFGKAMARTFDKYFFDGTGTASDFKGINTLIDEGFGTKRHASNGASNGGPITLDDLDKVFDDLRSQSSPDALLCNRAHRRKITNIGRGGYGSSGYFSYIDIGSDNFGRKVTEFNGVPLRIIGDDKDGSAILDFDETDVAAGSSSVVSSLYAIAYGDEENVTGLMGAGGTMEVVDFGETEAAPGHLGRVEFYPGIAIFNPYSVVRLAGITDA